MAFHIKLRSLIEENNLTQKKLAKDLNIAPSTLGGYVQGTSEPDFETLKNIAAYFQVSADYLLDIPQASLNDSTEGELLRIYRTLLPEQKMLYIEQGKAFLRVRQLFKEKNPLPPKH